VAIILAILRKYLTLRNMLTKYQDLETTKPIIVQSKRNMQ